MASEFTVNGVSIDDTFAEAFPIMGTRLLITAVSERWAQTAASEFCGNATSVIACDVEAGIESSLHTKDFPDGRHGVSVLAFAFTKPGLEAAVTRRVGQCVLTCPTTACYNGLPAAADSSIRIGGQLRYFGDGFQVAKRFGKRRLWRIPVMDGEFVCEDHFGTVRGIAGGNLLIAARSQSTGLSAAQAAAQAMKSVAGIVLPFPGGIVRSGSKVGSRYPNLKASTNDAWCPTLRAQTQTALPTDASAVYEIVIDGLDADSISCAMHAGLHAAAASPGVVRISAGNYGGQLGPHHFHLRNLLEKTAPLPAHANRD